MYESKLLLTILVVLSVTTMMLYSFAFADMNQLDAQARERMMLNFEEAPEQIKFDDPEAAYEVLTLLDVFEKVESPEDQGPPGTKPYFWGLKINDNYCDEHREYFVNNPKFIFQNKNFLSDYWDGHRLRDVTIPEIGRDVHPDVGFGMKKASSFTKDLGVDVNIFYTNRIMHWNRKVGKQFSCLTQISNHLTNHDNLRNKDEFTAALVDYQRTYSSRPQCLNDTVYFPKSYVLYKEDHCRDFFKAFNDPSYVQLKKERRIVYMRKIGSEVHEAMGIFPVDEKEEAYIRKLYANGDKCGQVMDNSIMQYLIPNPLLLENRKFDFRVFLFIASTNPVIAYYYDGNLKVSLHEYDTSSEELGVFVTNIALSKALFAEAEKNGTYKGLTSEELRSKSHWTYSDFFNYLMKTGKISDPNWIENHLRREIKKVLTHVVRLASGRFAKKSSMSELYGVDLIMDDQFNVWFIEANPRPMIRGWTPEIVPYFDKALKDGFEISFGLLKSRTKRIIQYVNDILRESNSYTMTSNGISLNNLSERREEFRQLSMNYFEPEYQPSPTNGYQLIVDENVSGKGRYFGLTEQCF